MSPLTTSALVFACVFGGTLLGFRLRSVVPEEHLNAASRDLVKLGMGIIATMSALVLGLLVTSAKNSYDAESRALIEMSAKIVLLDRVLAHYGPEAQPARELLKVTVSKLVERMWSNNGSHTESTEPIASRSEIVYERVQELVPTTDAQRTLQSRALNIATDIGQMRWLMLEQASGSASTPLLVIVVFSLTITFMSFGLHAPPNGTIVATLFLCALSVSGVMYLILEMYMPFGGLISIPSDPLRAALTYLGQ